MSDWRGTPTYSKDRLPVAYEEPGGHSWADFRKATLTRAIRISGPFEVVTIHGGAPQRCSDGWVALDSEGHPYPIDVEVFDASFEPAAQDEARRLEKVEQAGHRIDTAKAIPRAGEEAPDGWQGAPPAEGTRRKLILDTINDFSLRLISGAGGKATKTSCRELADAIEGALIRVVDQGATPESGSPASVAMDRLDGLGIPRTREGAILTIADRVTVVADEVVELRRGVKRCREESDVDRLDEKAGSSLAALESAKALNHLIFARRECVDPAELARLNEAITAAHMVLEPPSFTAVAEAVREEVGEDAPTDDVETPGAPRGQIIFEVLDRLYKDKTQWSLTPIKVTDALEEALAAAAPGNLELVDQARQALLHRIDAGLVDADQLIEILGFGE